MSGSLSGGGLNITFEDKDEFPSQLTYGKNADWTSESPITSFAPIMGFKSSTAAAISITIRFSIEEGPVMKRVKQCRSIVVPESGSYRPPQLTLDIENYITGFKGVAMQMSEAVVTDGSWVDGEPTAIDVTIQLSECDTKPLTSVYGGGG